MTTHNGRAAPFAHLFGLPKRNTALKPAKSPRASAPKPKPAVKPALASLSKGKPKIRAASFSHLFVNPPPAEAPHATSTPAARPSAPGAAQTSPKPASAAAERDLAARIIAAGRKRRGEAS